MFARLVNYFRELRVNADFLRYEEKCRSMHNHQAEIRFSTQQLEKEISSINKRIQNEAESIFTNKITELRTAIAQIESEINHNKKLIELLVRDYKKELDEAYKEKTSLYEEKNNAHAEKKGLHGELSNAFERKKQAYDSLNHYKGLIDSWYARSKRTPLLFGKGGKKIPNHSVFRQSHGDLDSYKYDRDKAYGEAQKCKNVIGRIKDKIDNIDKRIGDIKQRIGSLNQKSKDIKAERSRMYALVREGLEKAKVELKINRLQSTLNNKRLDLSELELLKDDFIHTKKQQYGIDALENEIDLIQSKKREFINLFDLEEHHMERVNKHRSMWLKERNLG